MLCWSKKHLDHIKQVNFKVTTLQEKQLRMIAYLFELAYDLMLAQRDNVSRSPGFETPLGIFGGQDGM